MAAATGTLIWRDWGVSMNVESRKRGRLSAPLVRPLRSAANRVLHGYAGSAVNEFTLQHLGFTVVSDYQHYLLRSKSVTPLGATATKWRRLRRAFEELVPGARVADLGCNLGFFSFRAALSGAQYVQGMDMQEGYIQSDSRRAKALGYDTVSFQVREFAEAPEEPFDVTICLSLFHRVYGSEGFETFDLILEHVASFTRRALFAEFVPQNDPLSEHVFALRGAEANEGYSQSSFEGALERHLGTIDASGPSAQPGRTLYVVRR